MSAFRIFVVLGAVGLAGCVEATGGGPSAGPKPNETIMEKVINASSAMDLETNREGALATIASRKDLSQSDQVYLVKTIYATCQQDQTKVNLLTILINNPSIGSAPCGVIVDGLRAGMKEDISRRRVLQMLQDRGLIEDSVSQSELEATTRAATRPATTREY
jgi:hypothetical protein